jgi:hypothetical protein
LTELGVEYVRRAVPTAIVVDQRATVGNERVPMIIGVSSGAPR